MDMEGQQPSTTPLPAGEGTAPTPTPTDTGAATVILPREPTETPPPDAPPTEYSDQEYGELLEGQGLGEFKGDARALSGIRAFDADYNVYLNAYQDMVASLPPWTVITPAAPLAGEALERAIATLATRYFPQATASQRSQARPLLERAAQETHRLTQALSAGDRYLPTVKAKQEATREARTLAQATPAVQVMTDKEFSEVSHSLWDQIRAAKDAGNYGTAERLTSEHDRMFQARYPGKH